MREPRLRALVLVSLLIATPAVALQWRCLGGGCEPEAGGGLVPFCGLDERTRQLVEAGHRAGRSPDVLAVAAGDPGVATSGVPWPNTEGDATEVPIALVGPGLDGARLLRGAGLDRIAPSLALAAGVDRPFPEVRSGTAFDGVTLGRSPLLVIVTWVGVGSRDLREDPDASPAFTRLIRTGAGTTHGSTGSLPVDPAATLTTIGTGGLPSQHGITGSVLRGEDGRPVAAFGRRSPLPVIASLAEDLDEGSAQAARVALVAGAPEDRGLIGGGWYLDSDRDDITLGEPAVATVRRLLDSGYGTDAISDVIGVTLRGSVSRMDADTARIIEAVRGAVPDAVVAVAGTGSGAPVGATSGEEVAADLTGNLGIPASTVDAVAADGLFLQEGGEFGSDRIAEALRAQIVEGRPRFEDAFPGYLVELARYC